MSLAKLEMLEAQLRGIESGLHDPKYTYSVLVMRAGICYWQCELRTEEVPDFVKEFNEKLVEHLKSKIEAEKELQNL
jgi:hypothetical protein